jgi:hypothetical protein
MCQRKTKAAQYELPQAGAVFNLKIEFAEDGERAVVEIKQREQARREAEELEKQQQLTMLN